MSNPITKVTDLVQKSLDELSKAQGAADSHSAARFERNASTYAELATAQSVKTSNLIAYLNSDRRKWNSVDDAMVREMLGLPSLGGDSDGGEDSDTSPSDDAPTSPSAAVTPVEPASAPTPALDAVTPAEAAGAPQVTPEPVTPSLVPAGATVDLPGLEDVDFA